MHRKKCLVTGLLSEGLRYVLITIIRIVTLNAYAFKMNSVMEKTTTTPTDTVLELSIA